MDKYEEIRSSRKATASLLSSVAGALHRALDDVRAAQDLIEPDAPQDAEDVPEAVRELLQAIEGNLTDTVIGIRLVKKRRVHRRPPYRNNGRIGE